LSEGTAPPGWYPDPHGAGQRYFDGSAWTGYTVPWPPLPTAPYGSAATAWWGTQQWKGARYGRPPSGPGSLADPGRRLAARLLDGLVFLPVAIACVAVALALVAPHAGPIFPRQNADPNATVPTPGFVWLYLAVAGGALVSGGLFVLYETVTTVRFGRTLGKRWMKIRPLALDGCPLGWGRGFARAATQWIAGFLGWLGFIDFLWCLWDADRQCLHDKIVGTLVVDD
jgi:uncharacterized RDD family membrane protein YckC